MLFSALFAVLAADFKAGAFAVDVTPTLPISLNGGMQDRTAVLIHDPMHARCFVFDNGAAKLAIVVVDSCMVPDAVMLDAKKLIQEATGIPPESVCISATHTHSAPTLREAFQSKPQESYPRFLAQQIAKGVTNAHAQRQPAKLGWASVRAPEHVFNRRWKKRPGSIPPNPFGVVDSVQMNPKVGDADLVEPAGPTDPEVVALSLRTKTSAPIGAFANYSLHYVGDVPGTAVSADYFGVFSRAVGEFLDAGGVRPPFVGAMSNGTSGDINNIRFRKAHPPLPSYGRCTYVGEDVAKSVAAALRSAPHQEKIALKSAAKTLTLGVRKPTADDLKRAERILAAAKGPALRTMEEIYAGETRDMAKAPDAVPVRVQVFRIGDVGIVQIPCEVFVEIGLEIKKKSPLKPTFVVSLANGYAGYLPTPEHHKLGGYETWRAKSSFLETDASPKIVAAALELLDAVK